MRTPTSRRLSAIARSAERPLAWLGSAALASWSSNLLLLAIGGAFLPAAREDLALAEGMVAVPRWADAVVLLVFGLALWLLPSARLLIARGLGTPVRVAVLCAAALSMIATGIATKSAAVAAVAQAGQAVVFLLLLVSIGGRCRARSKLDWAVVLPLSAVLSLLSLLPAGQLVTAGCLFSLVAVARNRRSGSATTGLLVTDARLLALFLLGAALCVSVRAVRAVTHVENGTLVEVDAAWPVFGESGLLVAKLLVVVAASSLCCVGLLARSPGLLLSVSVTWPVASFLLVIDSASWSDALFQTLMYVLLALGALCASTISRRVSMHVRDRDAHMALSRALGDRGLSTREAEVLCALHGGGSVTSVAEALGVSRSTVGSYCARAYRKIGVRTQKEAFAVLDGLIAEEDEASLQPRWAFAYVGLALLLATLALAPWIGPDGWVLRYVREHMSRASVLVAVLLMSLVGSGSARARVSLQAGGRDVAVVLAIVLLLPVLFTRAPAALVRIPSLPDLLAISLLACALALLLRGLGLFSPAVRCCSAVSTSPSVPQAVGLFSGGAGWGLAASIARTLYLMRLIPRPPVGAALVVVVGLVISASFVAVLLHGSRARGISPRPIALSLMPVLLPGFSLGDAAYVSESSLPLALGALSALTVAGCCAAVGYARLLSRRCALGEPDEDQLVVLVRKAWGLTEAPARVAVLVARGESVAQVANRLVVSQTTVRSHLRTVYHALDVHSRSELVIALAALQSALR